MAKRVVGLRRGGEGTREGADVPKSQVEVTQNSSLLRHAYIRYLHVGNQNYIMPKTTSHPIDLLQNSQHDFSSTHNPSSPSPKAEARYLGTARVII